MRYENLIMFQDTMSILESGYYVVGNERKKLKLTRTQMEASEVYLPEDVQEITERKNFEHQHELGRCEYGCENIDSLWNMKLEEGMCFAAASHTTEEGILDNINRIRLETSSVYFNTGVLLMDLTKCRELVRRDDIFSFIRDNGYKFILPDQDVFNATFEDRGKKHPPRGHSHRFLTCYNADGLSCPLCGSPLCIREDRTTTIQRGKEYGTNQASRDLLLGSPGGGL